MKNKVKYCFWRTGLNDTSSLQWRQSDVVDCPVVSEMVLLRVPAIIMGMICLQSKLTLFSLTYWTFEGNGRYPIITHLLHLLDKRKVPHQLMRHFIYKEEERTY